MKPTFRARFRGFFAFDVRTGTLQLVLFGLVLQANVTGSYEVVSLVFVAMAVLPWVVLTPQGRRQIGIVRPSRWRWLVPAAVTGAAACVAIYATATARLRSWTIGGLLPAHDADADGVARGGCASPYPPRVRHRRSVTNARRLAQCRGRDERSSRQM